MSSIHPAAADSYNRSRQREDDLEPITLLHPPDSGSISLSGSDYSIESPSSMLSRSTLSEGGCELGFVEDEESEGGSEWDSASMASEDISS